MNDITSKLGVEEQLEKDGIIASCTSGYSMYPMLYNRRDCVVIEKYRGNAGKYDVLLYRTPKGKLVLHRVVKSERMDEKLVIRGDNCPECEYVPEEWVIGKLVEFTRKNKNFKVTDKGYRFYSRLIVAVNPMVALKLRAIDAAVKMRKRLKKTSSSGK